MIYPAVIGLFVVAFGLLSTLLLLDGKRLIWLSIATTVSILLLLATIFSFAKMPMSSEEFVARREIALIALETESFEEMAADETIALAREVKELNEAAEWLRNHRGDWWYGIADLDYTPLEVQNENIQIAIEIMAEEEKAS